MIWSLVLLTLMSMRCLSQIAEPSTCNSCCQGPIGPQGTPGIPGVGIPGSHGTNGIPGAVGSKGELGIGIKGAIGPNGDPGVIGESGEKGGRGESGVRGLPGKVGPSGPRGLTGLGDRGPRGLPGIQGDFGERGAVGVMGLPGVPGRSAVTRRSAFTATKTSSQTGNANDVVLFQQLVTDIGNDYDTSNSKFTCRFPGVYFFMFSFNTDGSAHDILVGLVKNDIVIVGALIDKQNRDDQIGNGAVVHLVAGDQVWLKFRQNNNQQVDTHIVSENLSSFSGFLMYED